MKKICLSLLSIVMVLCITGCGKYEYKCGEGYELVKDQCRIVDQTKEALVSYKCDEGQELKDNKCSYVVTKEKSEVQYCDGGYKLSNGKCSRTVSKKANAKYSCSKGTLSGSKCVVGKVADTGALVCTKYCIMGSYDAATGKCKSTSPSGRVDYYNTVCKYSCSRGKLEGSMCYVDYTTNADVSYSCEAGYTKNGTNCSKVVTVDAKKKYGCADGYTLSNDKCTKTETIDAKKELYCEDGFELIDNQCVNYKFEEPTKEKK